MIPNVMSILDDPATELVYITAVSNAGETTGQTVIRREDGVLRYEHNVTLTAAALLDGVKRNQEAKKDVETLDTNDFLEDVMERMKTMNEDAIFKKEDP